MSRARVLRWPHKAKLGDRDPGPAFQVLQTYGDANTAAELEKLVPQWNYYATMALAGLPAGQGGDPLIDQGRRGPEWVDRGQYKMAVTM